MAFDFDAAVTAPFRMQPGLRPLAEGTPQLTLLAPGSRHQREKLAVLSRFADEALMAVPGFDDGPALRAVLAHAAGVHAGRLSWDGHRLAVPALGAAVDADGRLEQTATGSFGLGDEIVRCLQGLPPRWRLTGLLALTFAEDLAVVDGANGRLPWLAVALPSHWAPADKLGRHFAEVHAPVADNTLLLRAADALVKLVAGPQRWERFVWNVTGHSRLHAHPARVPARRWPDDPAAAWPDCAWWRTEHQTFLPVPGTAQAVFTIHVDTQPLAQAITPGAAAARLHDAVATMSEAVLAYRDLGAVRATLLDWLARRAAEDPAP